MPDPRIVGIISDTHGLLRPEAIEVLEGADLIVHAGDIGKPDILHALRRIAPVFAVRGNVDGGVWARALPETEVVEVGSVKLYVIHDLSALDFSPETAGFDVVVSGHSHRSSVRSHDGVLFLNPGSAGPRRFRLPVTVARMQVHGRSVEAKVVDLNVEGRSSTSG